MKHWPAEAFPVTIRYYGVNSGRFIALAVVTSAKSYKVPDIPDEIDEPIRAVATFANGEVREAVEGDHRAA